MLSKSLEVPNGRFILINLTERSHNITLVEFPTKTTSDGNEGNPSATTEAQQEPTEKLL